jgi:Zn-dependent protease with chaperone function/uncharacterized tellurite resistance protein B-like protein
MAMDFFEHQEQARRRTGLLVVLFVAAVIGTVVSVNVLALVAFGALGGKGGAGAAGGIVAVTTLAVLAVVGIGMAVKSAQMSAGGVAVAEALGGRPLRPDTRDPDERRVLNVVEEMAIASGLPVPPVYILEDDTINAFAAGRTHTDSVIGLTRGCVQRLTRDELQGVVGHEFSHIFHQDTRLNIRLVALLGGILVLALIGRGILRSARFSRGSKNNGAPLMFGLGLLVIGSVGYFFGRLIQSAVSRQREFLADASAVQYTRNPDGLAGALEKIMRGAGSEVSAPRATEFSHFFFASGLHSLFATHPPPEERIRRIRGLNVAAMDPRGAIVGAGAGADRAAAARGFAPTASGLAPPPPVPPAIVRTGGAGGAAGRSVDLVTAAAMQGAVAEAGRLAPARIARARGILDGLPAEVTRAAHHPFDARAVVIGLVLARDATVRAGQFETVRRADARLAPVLEALAPAVAGLRPEQRLPVLEVAAGALAHLSPHQYAEFAALLSAIIGADGEVDRLEWTVRVVLRRAIERRGSWNERARRATPEDAALVASVLAYSGADTQAEADAAWQAARQAYPALPPAPLPARACTLDALDAALAALDGSASQAKRAVVAACVAAVCADGQTTATEAELLRAICDGMGVPVPPVAVAG